MEQGRTSLAVLGSVRHHEMSRHQPHPAGDDRARAARGDRLKRTHRPVRTGRDGRADLQRDIPPAHLWAPRTVSWPLISTFTTSRPRGHGPQPAQHDRLPGWWALRAEDAAERDQAAHRCGCRPRRAQPSPEGPDSDVVDTDRPHRGRHLPEDEHVAVLRRRDRAARDRVTQPRRRPGCSVAAAPGGLRAAVPLVPSKYSPQALTPLTHCRQLGGVVVARRRRERPRQELSSVFKLCLPCRSICSDVDGPTRA